MKTGSALPDLDPEPGIIRTSLIPQGLILFSSAKILSRLRIGRTPRSGLARPSTDNTRLKVGSQIPSTIKALVSFGSVIKG